MPYLFKVIRDAVVFGIWTAGHDKDVKNRQPA